MFPRPRLGLRQKVVLVLALTLLSGLTASTYLMLREQSEAILEETERRGQEVSYFLAQTLAYSVVAYDYHTVELLLKDVLTHEDIVYARVLGPRGNTMAEVGFLPQDETAVRHFTVPIALHGETVGKLTLALSTARIRATLERQKRRSQLRQALVLLAVLLGEFTALTILIVRPLARIAETMRTAAAQAAQGGGRAMAPLRLPPLGNDEFGEIVAHFNALHERLYEIQRQLAARVEAADLELKQAYERLARQAEALQQKNTELEALAVTDTLTGLYNRRYFERLMDNEIRTALRQEQILSVVLFDIAHFKRFNEQYGLHNGDRVIAEVARRLARRVRRSDVLCRFGGDEFFLLLHGATMGEAIRLATELHQAVCASPVVIAGESVKIGLSIGIATFPCPHPVENAEALFGCADRALRASKALGRDQIVHYAQLPHEDAHR